MPTQQSITWSRRNSLYILIVALCAITSFLLFLRPAEKASMLSFREKGQTYTSYEGVLGERKRVLLPGGATAILNSNTTLLVPADFATSHTLLLDGEAYFDSTAYPLIVKTNILTMTVTKPAAFKMRCFESQQGATAYVLRGETKVAKSYYSKTDDQPEMLGPGNMVLANKEIDLMEKETYHPVEMETWLQGKLVFQDEPFMNAVRKMEEWYSTEIYVEGDVSTAGGINGEFSHASLAKVLDEIKQTAGFSYKLKKNKVLIDF